MKIAYFTHYFPPAGFAAAINTYEIVTRLAKRGHEVFVFCQPTFRKTITVSLAQYRSWPKNLKIHQSLMTPPYLSITIPHVLNVFKALKHESDLAITQFHPFHLASFGGFLLKALRRKPWIVKVHDMVLDPFLPSPVSLRIFNYSWHRAFFNSIGKKANKIIVSTSELRSLLEKSGYSSDKIAVIPNGVDTKLFFPPTSKGKCNFNKTILYTGSMAPADGLDHLIKAFALLKRMSELKLVLIGDGPMRPSLMELTKKLGLEGKVVFYPYIRHESIAEFIRSSYVTVGRLIPSPVNFYTIPTKMLEYFACGKTVVSSAVSQDVLVDGYTGLVVKKPTPETIAEKLCILIEDEKLTAQLGENARQPVVERFDWGKIVNLLEREIQDVTSH